MTIREAEWLLNVAREIERTCGDRNTARVIVKAHRRWALEMRTWGVGAEECARALACLPVLVNGAAEREAGKDGAD